MIPGLERQYNPGALYSAFKDSENKVAAYKPEAFERLAFPITGDGAIGTQRLPDWIQKQEADRIKGLREIIRSGSGRAGFSELPFLRLMENFEREQPRLWPIPIVMDHEGRHRSRAMAREGMPASLMRVEQSSMPEWMHFKQLGDLIQPQGRDLPGRVPRVAGETFLTEPFYKGGGVPWKKPPKMLGSGLAPREFPPDLTETAFVKGVPSYAYNASDRGNWWPQYDSYNRALEPEAWHSERIKEEGAKARLRDEYLKSRIKRSWGAEHDPYVELEDKRASGIDPELLLALASKPWPLGLAGLLTSSEAEAPTIPRSGMRPWTSYLKREPTTFDFPGH